MTNDARIAEAILGSPGHMITGSKTYYRHLFPDHFVVFNASLHTFKGRIWHGDLDLGTTRTIDDLKAVSAHLGDTVFVMAEEASYRDVPVDIEAAVLRVSNTDDLQEIYTDLDSELAYINYEGCLIIADPSDEDYQMDDLQPVPLDKDTFTRCFAVTMEELIKAPPALLTIHALAQAYYDVGHAKCLAVSVALAEFLREDFFSYHLDKIDPHNIESTADEMLICQLAWEKFSPTVCTDIEDNNVYVNPEEE